MYAENAPKLKRFWHQYCPQIIQLGIANAQGSNNKDSVEQLSTPAPISDDEQNWLSRLALHALAYLMPKKNKSSKPDLTKMFMKINNGTRVAEKIQELSEIAKKKNETFSPFILYFEDENLMPNKFFVCINYLIYENSNFLTALNLLFKSYYCMYSIMCIHQNVNRS